MLVVENLESGYGPMQVLWQPSLRVKKGGITSLLGPNGVGKSTLLRTVLGSVKPWNGKITYEGLDVTYFPTHKKVDLGLTLVPEGKHLFVSMTVQENLIMGDKVLNSRECLFEERLRLARQTEKLFGFVMPGKRPESFT